MESNISRRDFFIAHAPQAPVRWKPNIPEPEEPEEFPLTEDEDAHLIEWYDEENAEWKEGRPSGFEEFEEAYNKNFQQWIEYYAAHEVREEQLKEAEDSSSPIRQALWALAYADTVIQLSASPEAPHEMD